MFVNRSGVLTRAFCHRFMQNHSKFTTSALNQFNRQLNYQNSLQSSFKDHVAGNVTPLMVNCYSTSTAGLQLKQNEPVVILDRLPDVKITRKVFNEKDKTGLELVLFQYQTCPFCCKVRVFLDSKGLSYSVVEVDAVLRQSTKWSSYKKVPMMLARTKDGKYAQLTDSSAMVSILATILEDPNADLLQLAKQYATEAGATSNGGLPTKYYLKTTGNNPRSPKTSIV